MNYGWRNELNVRSKNLAIQPGWMQLTRGMQDVSRLKGKGGSGYNGSKDDLQRQKVTKWYSKQDWYELGLAVIPLHFLILCS